MRLHLAAPTALLFAGCDPKEPIITDWFDLECDSRVCTMPEVWEPLDNLDEAFEKAEAELGTGETLAIARITGDAEPQAVPPNIDAASFRWKYTFWAGDPATTQVTVYVTIPNVETTVNLDDDVYPMTRAELDSVVQVSFMDMLPIVAADPDTGNVDEIDLRDTNRGERQGDPVYAVGGLLNGSGTLETWQSFYDAGTGERRTTQ